MSLVCLELDKVSKQIGTIKILADISLTLESGKVLALLGDNGAGKSTLIKLISGVHLPTNGAMRWFQKPIRLSTFTPNVARHLGIQTVYQHLGMVETLSVARNFFLGKTSPFAVCS